MPLADPPPRHLLWRLPKVRLAGRTLWRCFRNANRDGTERPMWWFSSSNVGDPHGGRFDLPPPDGSCYTSTSLSGAVLEALQRYYPPGALVPVALLKTRVVAATEAPADAPMVANLNDKRALSVGVTAALWADRDRDVTRRWAAELHGSGHQAVQHGLQHDPGGRLRGITLFDAAGAHGPWGLPWPKESRIPCTDERAIAALRRRGIEVSHYRPHLQVVDEDDG